jgi:transposase
LQRHYKNKTSGLKYWEQLSHSEDYLIYHENIGKHLSIDELSLSKGELYTFVTNKKGRGTKISKRNNPLYGKQYAISFRMCFPESYLVTDRFNVVKLIMEALQYLRIKY